MSTISAVPNQALESLGRAGSQSVVETAENTATKLKVETRLPEIQQVSMDQLNNVVTELREFLGSQDSMSFNIRIDDSLREPVIQIVDQDSGESVKQIPTEQALQISRAILEMRGLFIDESA